MSATLSIDNNKASLIFWQVCHWPFNSAIILASNSACLLLTVIFPYWFFNYFIS